MNTIIGISGKLGSRIAQSLIEKGEKVRGVSRNPGKLEDLKSRGVELIQGDLRETTWMDKAMENTDHLFIASHGLVPPSRKNNIKTVDQQGCRNLIDAAVRNEVQRVYYTSALLAKPDSGSLFGRIKYGIEEYLKDSGLKYTIVRSGAFIETHALELIGEPLNDSGKVQFFGKGKTPFRWVSVKDVADLMVSCRFDPDSINTVKSIGGPDFLSRVQVLELFEEALGKKARRSHMPVWLLKMIKMLSRPINPGLSYLIDTSLAEETDPGIPAMLDWVAPLSVNDIIDDWSRAGG